MYIIYIIQYAYSECTAEVLPAPFMLLPAGCKYKEARESRERGAGSVRRGAGVYKGVEQRQEVRGGVSKESVGAEQRKGRSCAKTGKAR